MDILLSWNCRPIANATIQARLRRLVESAGFDLPVICTPDELMENDHEQNEFEALLPHEETLNLCQKKSASQPRSAS